MSDPPSKKPKLVVVAGQSPPKDESTAALVSNTLDQLLENLHTQMNDGDTVKNLRAQAEQLLIVQAELKQRLAVNRTELARITRQKSPLLALGDVILRKVCPYLSDIALLALEKASKPLVHSSFFLSQWKQRDSCDVPALRSGVKCRGEGVIRFKEASTIARHIEKSAKIHYHTNRRSGTYSWPTPHQFYSADDFCQDFKSFYRNNASFGSVRLGIRANVQGPVPLTEFFVRVSYKEDDGSLSVLMEGFRPPVLPPKERYMNATTMGFGEREFAEDIFISMRFADPKGLVCKKSKIRPEGESFIKKWPKRDRKAFLDRVAVTVLACDLRFSPYPLTPQLVYSTNSYPLLPQLVVSTDSYYGWDMNIGFLNPRDCDGKRSISDEDDCINVGLYPFPRGGFGLFLRWGEYADMK